MNTDFNLLRFMAGCLFLLSANVAGAKQEEEGVSFKQRRLAILPEEARLTDLAISPDGRRVAYVLHQGRTWQAVVDGTPGESFSWVGKFRWSANGRSYTYRAVRRGAVPKKRWGASNRCDVRGGKYVAVFNGRPGREYDWMGDPALGPHGKRVAFPARNGADYVIVENGREGRKYASADTIHFGPKGKRMVAVVGHRTKDRKTFEFSLWEGRKKGRAYDSIRAIRFSPDGNSLAYEGITGRRSELVLDGRVVENAGFIGFVLFAPDGKSLVYSHGEKVDPPQVRLVIGAWRSKAHRGSVTRPVFSPRGKKFAYGVQTQFLNWDLFRGAKGQRLPYEPGWMGYLPDGTFLHTAWKDEKCWLIRDGKAGRKFDAIDSVWVHPNRGTIVFLVAEGNRTRREPRKWFLVVGDRRVDGPYDAPLGAETARFSKDGRKFAFAAKIGRELWWRVLSLK